MVKKIVSLFCLVLIIGGCAKQQLQPITAPPPPSPIPMMDGKTGATMSIGYVARLAAKADAIFIGEIHNDSLTHVIELKLLEEIYKHHKELAVAMEMFERDVQPALDQYLAGQIDEATFLAGSRPWGNYRTAYRPLVSFAKEKGLPVLAMNVPRKYAGKIAMQGAGAFEAFADSVRPFLATDLKVLDDDYKVKFLAVMKEDMPGAMTRMNPENMYAAQCLKDDTMAESIDAFIKGNPKAKVVSYQGDFHSDNSLGIVKKLKILNPEVKTAVISILPVEDTGAVDFKEYVSRGDYLVFVKSHPVK